MAYRGSGHDRRELGPVATSLLISLGLGGSYTPAHVMIG